jgi:hypothetical protein
MSNLRIGDLGLARSLFFFGVAVITSSMLILGMLSQRDGKDKANDGHRRCGQGNRAA